MPLNENILTKLEAVLPQTREVKTADLRLLFQQDCESVYELALQQLPEGASIAALGLQRLARTVSILMRDGFGVESVANQQFARGRRGGILPLDDGQPDLDFIRQLYSGSGYASKMDSRQRSRKCTDFFLNEQTWDDDIRNTLLLRVAPEDTQAILGGLPRYQYASLLDCAREVVRCPTVVYKGLRHDGPMKTDGFAFCGLPSRRHMNNGDPLDPPPGLVFAVFVNQDGYVFDWDWLPAANDNPLIPRNAEERFPHGVVTTGIHGELLLGNVRGKPTAPFQPWRAWFCNQGDCVFWYHSDRESYADRYDEYLTAFFDATNLNAVNNEKPRCVGFKLKMVSRLFETIQRWARPGTNEGIIIKFNQDTIEVEFAFLMKAWLEAALPTRQELFPGMRLMEQLGTQGMKALQEDTQRIEIPKRSLDAGRALEAV